MFRLSARKGLIAVCAATLLATVLAAPAAADGLPATPSAPVERSADSMTADSLPTVQINSGVVWSQAIVGDTVYAGGEFTQTRPAGAAPGQSLTPRSNLLAYNLTTGELLPFNVPVNGAVKAVAASPDGKTLYIGGSFTQVGGKQHYLVAAIDLATGTVSDSFKAAVGGSFVNALAVTDSTVYAGGLFTQASGVARKNLAAFTTDGTLTAWAPTADQQVDGMIVAPQNDRIIAAGRFGKINGSKALGTASINATTGAGLPWAMNQNASSGIINGATNAAGTMQLATDGTTIYGAAWQNDAISQSNCEGVWAANAETGQLVWMTAGSGDEYAVYAAGSTVYTLGHSHNAAPYGGWPDANTPSGDHQYSVALTAKATGSNASGGYWSNSGKPAPAIVQWYPSWMSGTYTGTGQAGWTLTGNGKYMVAGGEFVGVNGVNQQGLARFATKAVTKPASGPRLYTNPNNVSGRTWETPTFAARPGGATVSIRPNYDRDDRDLTYQLLRSGTKNPVATTTVSSDPWLRTSQNVTLSDYTGSPGTTYTYTVRAVDGDGNTADSKTVTGTTGTGQAPASNAYSAAVTADGPSLYYRLGGGSQAAVDQIGANDGNVGSGVTNSANSPIAGDSGTGSAFDGTSNGRIGAKSTVATPSYFSTEAWFKTTTTKGGKITGYGNSSTGTSSSYDRHVYMYNDGRLGFGVYTGTSNVVSSDKAYNDGKWHQVVATLGSDGMKLYVDGAVVASNASVTSSSDSYNGYWRLGGDNLNGWPTQPSSAYFAGDLDEFAVYAKALTADQVAGHYKIGTNGAVAPVDPAEVSGSVVGADSFDRSGSAWGSADTGGAWSTAKGTSLDGGQGVITLSNPGQTITSYLTGTKAKNIDMSIDVSMDKAAVGGGTFAWAIARHTDTGDYRVKLVQNTNQTISLTLVAQTGTDQTTLATTVLKNYSYTPGQTLTLRFQATTDHDRTDLKAKAWKTGESEPDTWTLTTTDTTPTLQTTGNIGVAGYLSNAATNTPQTLRIDNLTAHIP